MDVLLSAEEMNALMHEFVDIESSDPDEDEAFARIAMLFNRIYAMGQNRERGRWTAQAVSPPSLKRGEA